MECIPLAAEGFRVRFLAPHGLAGSCKGVDLVSLPMRNNRFLRMVLATTLLLEVLRQGADLYFFQDPELLPLGLVLKLIFRRRVVYDAYEDFPSMVKTRTWIPPALRSLVSQMLSSVEHLATCCLDGVITADPFTLRRLARAGTCKKLVFFNFPNLDFFPDPEVRPKRFDLVYRGGLSQRAGVFLLLEALRILVDQGRRPQLLLMGYFDDDLAELKVREQISSLKLEPWITVGGRVAHEDMARSLSEARIGICPLQPIPKFLLNIPVKVFEYWACGLPVVATDLPPIRPFFRDREYGFLIKPEDPGALARAIGWLLDHPKEATDMGARGRQAVLDRYNNRKEIRKLSLFLCRILH